MNLLNTGEKLVGTVINSDRNNDIADWLVKDVALSLFPIGAALLMDFLKTNSVDWAKLIGDGTLVLSSFSIAAPAVFNTIKMNNIDKAYKIHGYILTFFCFFLLLIYAVFKTSANSDLTFVITISLICLFFAVIASYRDFSLREFIGGGNG